MPETTLVPPVGMPGPDKPSMPGMPGAAPSGTPSGASPEPAGEKEIAKANVQIALAMLTKQLAVLGADNDEGKAVLQAVTTLSKKFSGKTSEDLAPAELMQVMQNVPDQYKKAMLSQAAPGGPGPGMPPPPPMA